MVSAQGGADCCVPLPVVATSKEPAKGSVHSELRHTDLEAIFSNRHIMFAGGWDDAFAALTYEIDRSGAYKMREKAAPRIARQVGLEESGFIDILIHPPPVDAAIPDRRPGTRNQGANPWSRTTDPHIITTALVATLARINKYGEPAAGL